MPAHAGERTLVTLFADIHYFLGPPTQKPVHHRFDKGSYVYIHQDSSSGAGRLEIANNAGTSDQDAFAGDLGFAQIKHSYKQAVLFNISIDKSQQQRASSWKLPAYDPSNQRKYLYPLDSMDIYFWTPEDSRDFTDALRKIQPVGSIQIDAKPVPAQAIPGTMSSVVSKLEQMAITSPGGAPGPTTSSSGMPPPPAAPAPGQYHQQQYSGAVPQNQQNSTAAPPAPMAYNPAAPAAPEPIAHREKTPPPPDGNTGLAAAAAYDGPVHHPSMPYQNNQFSNFNHHSYNPQPQQFAGPPTPGLSLGPSQMSQMGRPQYQQQSHSTSSVPKFSPPPTQASNTGIGASQAQQAPSFAPPPTQAPTSPPSAVPGTTSSPYMGGAFQTPSPQQQSSVPLFAPPPTQESAAGHGNSSASPPLGGFSNYSYNSTASQGQSTTGQSAQYNDIHGMAYRPTEAEAKHGHGSHVYTQPHPQSTSPPAQGQGQGQGLEAKVSRVEKGVNRFLKRLDKGF